MKRCVATLAAALAISVTANAEAFCGFYVGGADAKLFNNATVVALMREGQRTVLSMQNNYQGPPENFAMVIPVPVVLQKENVKTLPAGIFDKLDRLTAPRLVEYWEQDPCRPREELKGRGAPQAAAAPGRMAAKEAAGDYGVKIEAQFSVGEYDVVVLSASDSSGLDRWLRDSKYKIPDGAEPYLRPYVQSGSKFFVAKVDTSKVTFADGQVTLSPLRFHYDSETFNLPIRLGLINSSGTQDLIVNILARGQRYEAANYPNVTIPTNLDITEGAKEAFPAFYTALFDRTMEERPRVVVTEYAWDAGTCDPCPTPGLTPSELMSLGMDALTPSEPSPAATAGGPPPSAPGAKPGSLPGAAPNGGPGATPRPIAPPMLRGRSLGGGSGFVVTRLHARYKRDALGDDLVFRAAPPIMGGREMYRSYPPGGGTRTADLEKSATSGSVNNFQARYAVRHEWTGPIACANPIRGLWGGPPSGAGHSVTPAAKIQGVKRGDVKLASLLREDVPELGIKSILAVETPAAIGAPAAPATKSNCGACVVGSSSAPSSAPAWLASLAIAFRIFHGRRARTKNRQTSL